MSEMYWQIMSCVALLAAAVSTGYSIWVSSKYSFLHEQLDWLAVRIGQVAGSVDLLELEDAARHQEEQQR